MNTGEALALADSKVWPYRILGRLPFGALTITILALALFAGVGFLAALILGQLQVLTAVPVLGLLLGLSVGLAAFSWHRRALATAIADITPAAHEPSILDEVLREAFRHFPPNLFLIITGTATAGIIYLTVSRPSNVTNFYRFYYGALCLPGGLLFSYGIAGFLWTYYLVLKLAEVRFSIFHSHRLLALSTLVCGLAFFGVWPIGFTAVMWALKPKLPIALVAIGEIILLLMGWALAEVGIHRINSRSRQAALDLIGSHLDELWQRLQGVNNPEERKMVYSAIEEAHKVLEHLRRYRSGIVDWGALCGKVIIPIVIATTAASTAGIIKLVMDRPQVKATSTSQTPTSKPPAH